MTRFPSARRFALCALAIGALSAPAQAQWTLPQGDIALVASYEFQHANREFRDGHGRPTRFPLRGRSTGSTLGLGARIGLTDRLEFELYLPMKLVSYTADPVILLSPDGVMGDLDFYQRNIIDLSQAERGLGDLYLTTRYSLLRRPLAMALEARLKTPTGYAGPEGTFGPDPVDAETFVANVGEIVRPENVSDDVTLGDGQVDLTLSLLLGASFPTRTFVRGDLGYNMRFGGAGDQVVGSVKIGQVVLPRLLIYAESRLAYTVTEGDVYGVGVTADNVNLPARDFQGLNNLVLREIRLERDAIDVSGGLIVKITPEIELNLGYARTVWGRNTAATNTMYLSVAVRASLAEPPAEDEYTDDEYADDEYADDEYADDEYAEPEAAPQDAAGPVAEPNTPADEPAPDEPAPAEPAERAPVPSDTTTPAADEVMP